MNVLIAEDDAEARTRLREALVRLGHAVLEAEDGAEAWRLLSVMGTRVVVSDWMMPKMDGLELCRRVRARVEKPYVYFILLTGQSAATGFARAMQAGVDDFLEKPLDEESLRVRLRVAERIVTLTERVRTLEGILPMCAYCRRIRDEKGAYASLEDFVSERTSAQFSHGVCPDCAKRLV
jgi:DNA-binding response OmpR family regulator